MDSMEGAGKGVMSQQLIWLRNVVFFSSFPTSLYSWILHFYVIQAFSLARAATHPPHFVTHIVRPQTTMRSILIQHFIHVGENALELLYTETVNI